MSPIAAAVKTASDEITAVAAFEAPQRGSLAECGQEVIDAIVKRLEGVGAYLGRTAEKLREQDKKYEELAGLCENAVGGRLAQIARKFTDPRCLVRTTRDSLGKELDELAKPFAQVAHECSRPNHPSYAILTEVHALNAYIGRKFFDVDYQASGTVLSFEPRG